MAGPNFTPEARFAAGDVAKLQGTIESLDAMSQAGFSEISTLADVALKLMETEEAYLSPETIAQILITIKAKAQDVENLINSEAERVGCNYKDQAAERRDAARRSAENSRNRIGQKAGGMQ